MKNKRKNKISDEEEKPADKIPKLRKSVRSVLSETLESMLMMNFNSLASVDINKFGNLNGGCCLI